MLNRVRVLGSGIAGDGGGGEVGTKGPKSSPKISPS